VTVCAVFSMMMMMMIEMTTTTTTTTRLITIINTVNDERCNNNLQIDIQYIANRPTNDL